MALLGLPPGEARALDVAPAMKGPGPEARMGPTKTRKNKWLPVPEEFADWLGAHVDQRQRLGGAGLFTNPLTRKRWSLWELSNTWLHAERRKLKAPFLASGKSELRPVPRG
jgi:hypothetical protein